MRLTGCSRSGIGKWARRGLLLLCTISMSPFAKIGWALPGTQNLSLLPGVVATASPSRPEGVYDTSPSTAIDGNRDGNYGEYAAGIGTSRFL